MPAAESLAFKNKFILDSPEISTDGEYQIIFAALPSFTSLATNLGSPNTLLTAKKSLAFTMAFPVTSIVQLTFEVSVFTPLTPFPVCKSKVSKYKSICVESEGVYKIVGEPFPSQPGINVLDPHENVTLKSLSEGEVLRLLTSKGTHPIMVSFTNRASGIESM